jgi:hypothetical protein
LGIEDGVADGVADGVTEFQDGAADGLLEGSLESPMAVRSSRMVPPTASLKAPSRELQMA